jgi:hypothetical protein
MTMISESDVNVPVRSARFALTPWRTALGRSLLVYLYSRLCVLVGAAVVAAELKADDNFIKAELPNAPWADPNYIEREISTSAIRPITDVLTSWDGIWYLRIVRSGYPRSVRPNVTYEVPDARAAFFPAYPNLVRAVDTVLPGGSTVAALLVNLLLGAVAMVLVGYLARRYWGPEVAEKAMMLFVLFPGAFVLSFAYTEALLLTFAAGCLLALARRQWLLAGVLAALGTATRPNGVALVAACAVASFLAIYRPPDGSPRQWRSLVAPLLAPIGFGGFQWWLGRHTGEAGVWFRVQTEAWGEGASFGVTALRRTFGAFTRPFESPTDVITMASVVAMALLLWMAWRYRPTWTMTAYIAAVLFLMLMPATVTARPRFLYTAFPLLISAAAWFHRRGRNWWPFAIGACSAGLVGLTALYGVLGAIP